MPLGSAATPGAAAGSGPLGGDCRDRTRTHLAAPARRAAGPRGPDRGRHPLGDDRGHGRRPRAGAARGFPCRPARQGRDRGGTRRDAGCPDGACDPPARRRIDGDRRGRDRGRRRAHRQHLHDGCPGGRRRRGPGRQARRPLRLQQERVRRRPRSPRHSSEPGPRPGRPMCQRDRHRLHLRPELPSRPAPRRARPARPRHPNRDKLSGPADQPRPPRHRADRLFQLCPGPSPGLRARRARRDRPRRARARRAGRDHHCRHHRPVDRQRGSRPARRPGRRGRLLQRQGRPLCRRGRTRPALDAVLANAAGTLAARNGAASIGGFEDAFAAGLDQARTAVSSGAAARLLDQWIALAGELAGPS
jgi:hypothetical protein